jgi:hypothetical protein
MLAAASSKIWSFLQPPPYFPLLYCFAIVRMIVRSRGDAMRGTQLQTFAIEGTPTRRGNNSN